RMGQQASAHTQVATLRVHVRKDVVEAMSPDYFRARIAGKLFRTFVPISDASIAIDEVNAVVDAIEQILVGEFVRRSVIKRSRRLDQNRIEEIIQSVICKWGRKGAIQFLYISRSR